MQLRMVQHKSNCIGKFSGRFRDEETFALRQTYSRCSPAAGHHRRCHRQRLDNLVMEPLGNAEWGNSNFHPLQVLIYIRYRTGHRHSWYARQRAHAAIRIPPNDYEVQSWVTPAHQGIDVVCKMTHRIAVWPVTHRAYKGHKWL